MSDDKILYDCEYVKSIADEYFHSELSEAEKESVELHIAECGECNAFYDEERELMDIIKAAAYSPETSVASLLMEKIIDEKIIIQKPRRNRPVPFGMISAAAIIVIMIAVSRTPIGDILGISMSKNSSLDNAAPESAAGQTADDISTTENAVIMPYYKGKEDIEAEKDEGETGYAQRRGGEDTDGVQFSLYDFNNDDNDNGIYNDSETVPAEAGLYEPEAAPAPAAVIAEAPAVVETPVMAEAAPAAVEGVQSQFSLSENMMGDIPIPTGEFCERQVSVIICARVSGDVKELLLEHILAEVEKADVSATNPDVIYMEEKYYNTVTAIFSENGVEYEIRESSVGANDIAVFFY